MLGGTSRLRVPRLMNMEVTLTSIVIMHLARLNTKPRTIGSGCAESISALHRTLRTNHNFLDPSEFFEQAKAEGPALFFYQRMLRTSDSDMLVAGFLSLRPTN
jgi:hypothetical protein